jgi:hypothetical protein
MSCPQITSSLLHLIIISGVSSEPSQGSVRPLVELHLDQFRQVGCVRYGNTLTRNTQATADGRVHLGYLHEDIYRFLFVLPFQSLMADALSSEIVGNCEIRAKTLPQS